MVHTRCISSVSLAPTSSLQRTFRRLIVGFARVVVLAARLVLTTAEAVVTETTRTLPVGEVTTALDTIRALGQAFVDVTVSIRITNSRVKWLRG